MQLSLKNKLVYRLLVIHWTNSLLVKLEGICKMAKNRKAAEQFILKYVERILPGSPNTQFYKDFFAKMSDKEFDEWITKVGKGDENLILNVPNMTDIRIDVARNIEIGKELGHSFFKRIWIKPRNGGPKYLSPLPHLVYKLPVRRQAQLLTKKISIPRDNNTVDTTTNQPTGESKGAKISYVELQILSALGLDSSIVELIKYRGGDVQSFHAMKTLIARNGTVNRQELKPFEGKVTSTETLKALLTAAHLESDL